MELCQICGLMVEVLTEVHVNKHGLTKEKYRELYGKQANKKIYYKKNMYKLSEIEAYEKSKAKRNY